MITCNICLSQPSFPRQVDSLPVSVLSVVIFATVEKFCHCTILECVPLPPQCIHHDSIVASLLYSFIQ